MTPVLDDHGRSWSAAALHEATDAAQRTLHQSGTRRLATLLDNGAAFVVLDEATADAGIVHLPLPLFFTPAQVQHALRSAGIDTLVAAPAAAPLAGNLGWRQLPIAGEELLVASIGAAAAIDPPPLPPATQKITFTSGSTAAPKGVCLSLQAMQRVADGLVQAMAPLQIRRHLVALPLAVLLENIAGLMAPRRAGATVLLQPLATLGLRGAVAFDAERFDAVLREREPHSLILLPQMLRDWCAHLQASHLRAPTGLRLVAVGGAAVGTALVHEALALGVPVGEGWGLSEAASVQTLNLPGAMRAGSVGRLLPHARLRVAGDGELLVGGSLFSGYLGGNTEVPEWWPSGDLGHVDADGFVHIHGRKKNLLITGFGRNVSPEWVETALRGHTAVAQAVVFGDGEAALSAVLWPRPAEIADATLQAAVDAANATLPDYARVARWTRARTTFDTASGMATANGRPRREAIAALHAAALHPDPATLTTTA